MTNPDAKLLDAAMLDAIEARALAHQRRGYEIDEAMSTPTEVIALVARVRELEAALAAERETCAKVADSIRADCQAKRLHNEALIARLVAVSIRRRDEVQP